MKKKSIITLVVALVMALLMVAQTPMTTLAAASTPKYISELLIVSATDEKQAKSKLGDDYQVLSTPLYESPKGKTYLAYKTTTDPKDAIVDIKAMNMYGGYSYGEYAQLLESQKTMTQQLVDGLKDAIAEFQSNYNDDKDGALYAEEMLRYFYYDDLDMTISELFLDYDVHNDDDSVLVTLFMQGNIDIIENIENLLMIACSDTVEHNFLEILDQKAEEVAKTDYEKPTVSEYSDNIADLLNTLMYVQYPIEFYNKCEEENPFTEDIQKEFERQQEEIDAYMTENPDVDEEKVILQIRAKYSETTAGRALIDYENYIEALSGEQFAYMIQGQLYSDVLKATRYPGLTVDGKPGTLYDLIMAHNVADEKERAEYSLTDFEELMKALTPGQRGLLKVGFAELLSTVITDKESYVNNLSFLRGDNLTDEEYEENKDNLLPYADETQISVFEGVDRTLYDADGIAMTSEAITLQSRNENASFQAGFLSEKVQKIMGYAAAASAGVAMISTTYLVAATISKRAAMDAANAARVAGNTTARTLGSKVTIAGQMVRNAGIEAANASTAGGRAVFAWLEETSRMVESSVGKEFYSVLGTEAGETIEKVTATPLRTAFSQVLSRAIGMVFFIIDIACLVEMVIELIVFLVDLVMKTLADAPYEPIPRVLCSAETVYNGHLNGDGERIYEDGYVFYYGVKNPEIDTTTTDPSGNLKKYAIADIYNWTLEGPDRQWIALYTTKDQRMGNPILADSLMISSETGIIGKQVMKYFHREDSCDTMYYYQMEEKDFLGIADRFIYFATATDEEMKSVSGSVFADGKTIAFGFGGLAVGAVGGALVTGFVKKKKETVEA